MDKGNLKGLYKLNITALRALGLEHKDNPTITKQITDEIAKRQAKAKKSNNSPRTLNMINNRIQLDDHPAMDINIDKNINGYNMAPANGGDILGNHPDKISIREKIISTHKKTISHMSSEERKTKFGKSGNSNPNFKNGGISYKVCPKCNINSIRIQSNTCGECRDRTGENNAFFKKHHSEKTKQLLREKMSGKNSWIKDIDPALLPYTKNYMITYPNGEIKQVAGLKSIAEEFNVSIENVHATIKRISLGKIPKRGVFAKVSIKEI